MSIFIIYYNYQEAFITNIEDEQKMLDKHFNSITGRITEDFKREVRDTEGVGVYSTIVGDLEVRK